VKKLTISCSNSLLLGRIFAGAVLGIAATIEERTGVPMFSAPNFTASELVSEKSIGASAKNAPDRRNGSPVLDLDLVLFRSLFFLLGEILNGECDVNEVVSADASSVALLNIGRALETSD
jgi:hypothetical protein